MTGAPQPSPVCQQPITLDPADMACIAAARRGQPLPAQLADKLATIVQAAADGRRIKVVYERVPDPAVELEKRFATAQAKLALAGFQLERMADGSFVAAKWTMTRALADVDAVEAFQRQVGAA